MKKEARAQARTHLFLWVCRICSGGHTGGKVASPSEAISGRQCLLTVECLCGAPGLPDGLEMCFPSGLSSSALTAGSLVHIRTTAPGAALSWDQGHPLDTRGRCCPSLGGHSAPGAGMRLASCGGSACRLREQTEGTHSAAQSGMCTNPAGLGAAASGKSRTLLCFLLSGTS